MSKMTQGKWEAKGDDDIVNDRGELVAAAYTREYYDENNDAQAANQQAIAALPELIEALKGLHDAFLITFVDEGGLSSAFNQIPAVIECNAALKKAGVE